MAKGKKVATVAPEFFEVDGKKYQVNAKKFPKVFIPGIGELTADEILISEEAQAYLVKHNCIGTIISEVIDEAEEPAD